MKNKNSTGLIILPLLLLSACGPANSINKGGLDYQLHQDLCKGFKATGNLIVETEYFEDEDYVIPYEEHRKTKDNIEMVLTYTNTKDYLGMDYKYYFVPNKGEKVLIANDNMYSRNGNLYFNSVGYDNVVSSEVSALDDNYNEVPYATNVSLNPFTLVKNYDFVKGDNDVYSLDQVKSSLVFGDLLYSMMNVPLNVNAKDMKFTVKDNVLTSISAETFPYFSIETIDLTNYYARTTYKLDLAISEIGKTNAKTEIQPEPEKPENAKLKGAIAKLAKSSSYRVNRHFTTPLDPTEETIDLYFSAREQAIYMAVYDRNQTFRPNQPTPADALFVDSEKDEDKLLNTYMLQPLNGDENNMKFQYASELREINNVLEYNSCLLNNLYSLSSDVFNRNPDGSFSPIPEHLYFAASDLFVPFLCTTNEIAGGYVTNCRIYLSLDKQNLSYIEIDTLIGDMPGHVTITYDQINECQIPFNALSNIVE